MQAAEFFGDRLDLARGNSSESTHHQAGRPGDSPEQCWVTCAGALENGWDSEMRRAALLGDDGSELARGPTAP